MAIRSLKRSFGSINSASMSDIAFLLLIFFLVTTIFSQEKGISMLIPPENAPPVKIQNSNILTVRAHPNGSITINNQQMTLQQMRSHAKERLIANDKLVIVLETHKDADYGLMIDILDELRLADARRITLRKIE
jgi:biopolymer transport protein ExbD